MMTAEQRLAETEKRLRETLSPSHLMITDESYKHKGHPGAATGMSHFHVEICAVSLAGKNRVTQHRMIYGALDDLMNTELHAVRITVLSP
ncbi:MAG: BolA family transcriptional regulator [Coxiellaceae bacterium]|nr:BolA family transcriptional regulator [Coxiellaceae bacterium]